MPAWQLTQTVLGLLIPFALIGHVLATRVLHELFGVRGSYTTELIALWLLLPQFGVLQAVLVVVRAVRGDDADVGAVLFNTAFALGAGFLGGWLGQLLLRRGITPAERPSSRP